MTNTNESNRVVLATDSGFLAPVACVLSMLDRHDPDLRVTILHDAVDAADRLRTTSHLRDRAKVDWIDVAELLPGHLTVTSHFTRMSYARLICPTAVPPDVRRIVYLDGDLLVRRSLGPLFELDLRDNPLGACVDPNAVTTQIGLARWVDFGIRPDAPYFNAGVLVIDASSWRRDGIAERSVEFASKHSADLQWADQDVINVLLGERCHRLEAQWNLLWGGWGRRTSRKRVGDALPAHELERALADPAIVHFAGSIKPWHPRYGGRLSSKWFDEWRSYAQGTAFSDQLLGDSRDRLTRLAWSPFVRPIDLALRSFPRLADLGGRPG
jgi:lipopolysaccharide biosynthesis glycosyltransferase